MKKRRNSRGGCGGSSKRREGQQNAERREGGRRRRTDADRAPEMPSRGGGDMFQALAGRDPDLARLVGLAGPLLGALASQGERDPAPRPEQDTAPKPTREAAPKPEATAPPTAERRLTPKREPESQPNAVENRQHPCQPAPELSIPNARPGFLGVSGSEYVRTPQGYTIEMANYDIRVYDTDGNQLTRIWGDPHVDEAGATNWHFGEDSTFILPDGTKLCLDTEPNSAGEWYVEGVDIIAGNSRYHFGTGDDGGMTEDALEWDKQHADRSTDASAGVFAMAATGEWAVQAADGHFYDINTESWSAYLGDRDIDFNADDRIALTAEQQYASVYDHIPGYVPGPECGEWRNGEGGRGHPSMQLQEVNERPNYLRYSDSDIVQTPDNYLIEMRAPEVIIFDREGNTVTRIWGDPHVDEGGDGKDEWHFGEDSSFILPDGTKIALDTEPNSAGEWYVVGVDVLMGTSRFHHGVGGDAGMTGDGIDFDRAHADRAEDSSAGVFALQDNGQWAVMAPDGYFYDITEESWSAYLGDRDIDFDPSLRANVTVQQQFAARSDQLPADMRIPKLGQIPDLDGIGGDNGDVAFAPLGGMSQKDAITVLQRYMPVWHINLIQRRAPLLLPMLAEDKYLAQRLASMPLRAIKKLLADLPLALLRPAGTPEPSRRRRDFDRHFTGWTRTEAGQAGGGTRWWDDDIAAR
jgi:hypothetical protein